MERILLFQYVINKYKIGHCPYFVFSFLGEIVFDKLFYFNSSESHETFRANLKSVDYSEKFFRYTNILYIMVRFLSCKELYKTIQQKSSGAKEVLWVCSPNLGVDAHKIFSQEILKNPPADTRFIFRVTDFAIKSGKVNPYEIQYLMEHFNSNNVKSQDNFHSNIYIFDNSALITSANLTKPSFESAFETGVLLDDSQVDEVKSFYNQSLWENAKTIKELQKLKRIWNITEKSRAIDNAKKIKAHTTITEWTDDNVSRWYFTIPDTLSKKTERKIKKETNWGTNFSVVADIGPNCFKHIKLGDFTYLANLTKKRGKIEVEIARILDKSCVETDEGDFHFAYKTEKNYLMERNQFYEMLKNATIGPKTWGAQLNGDQVKSIITTLSSTKTRKRLKPKNK